MSAPARMLPASAVARRLGVTRQTVDAWCRDGRLEAKVDGELLRPRRAPPRGWWKIPARIVEMVERGEFLDSR